MRASILRTALAGLVLLLCPGLPAQAQTTLQGAGATFPYPFYSKLISEYQKAHPQVRVNYQSIGSGGGIRQILERTVDFGATDAPMTPQERAKATAPLHHIPMTLGAVALAYNLPGVPSGLKLTPEVLSAIFLGQIRTWNDGRIAALNPGVNLPGRAIAVIYRTDGSGTTAVFTDYLAKVSPEWKGRVGSGKSVRFPAGLGAKGNEGVTGLVKMTPGAIGYLELAYARQNGLSMAAIRNRAGSFVLPSPEGVSSAAASVQVPDDLCLSITDGAGARDYPIAALSYLLVWQEQGDAGKGKALADFLWWALHDGQKYAGALDYAPLPKGLVAKVEARLKSLTAGGQALIPAKRK